MFWALLIITIIGIVLYHYLIVERGLFKDIGNSDEKDVDESGEERFQKRIEEKRVEKENMKRMLMEIVAKETATWESHV
jgi:hypothetical protein